jgi:hypothetical protein
MPKAKKPAARKNRPAARTKIRAAHWKRAKTIATDKFEAVSRAILKTLPKKGMRWGSLVDRVERQLPKFDGSVSWYTISCLRELETQGKVRREPGPPVLYSRKG